MIGNNGINNNGDNNQFNNLNSNVVNNINVQLNDNDEREKDKKKIQLTLTLILILFLSVTSATYAYFAISATNNVTIAGNLATVNLTLGVTKVYPKAPNGAGAMVPQLTGNPLSSALKAGCVDANTNVVCQVYKITIQNSGGTATQVVDGAISVYSNSTLTTNIQTTMPDLKWRLLSSVDETTPANNVLGSNSDITANSTGNDFANNITLATNASRTFYVVVWLNETNVDQIAQSGKTFYGQVRFDSSNGTGVTSTFTS